MEISTKLKLFIETHIKYIDENNLEEVFQDAYTMLTEREYEQLAHMFDSIDIDTTDLRWKIFEEKLLNRIAYELKDKSDKSNGWSRWSWMSEAINWCGFTESEILEHLKAHKQRLGLKMTPIESMYAWDLRSNDYDLGWFNREKFKEIWM